MSSSPVLVSWVAVNNDPYEREQVTGEARSVGGQLVCGPTLTLLCDKESPYAARIDDVVLLHRKSSSADDRELRAVKELVEVLRQKSLNVHLEPWNGSDPTDHREVFEFLRRKLPELRERFRGRELVLHVSPGTPSMHTVWVLMAETGFVDKPFTVVKSYRSTERNGRAAVVSVDIGIETFYKTYKASRPGQVASEDQSVIWDPAQFKSVAMKRVYSEARRFAQLNVPVLIRGERGTGKTTLANWIRSSSPFKRGQLDSRWPSVACGQYSPETMRSELFGYKKGSFTGAIVDSDGLLAAAHKDTLFLDEIGDISRDLQRLLIRAIEEKTYFRLGDDKPRKSDFRLITATNIDARELRTRLDPDFLDRISLLSIELPPLRQVPEELPWLWTAVYDQAFRRAGIPLSRAEMTPSEHRSVIGHLRRHKLPGNIRDLFRVAYRILAARVEVDQAMSSADVVAYGVAALFEGAEGGGMQETLAQSVAAAFARGVTIEELIEEGGSLETGKIFAELKAYLANEVKRISGNRSVKSDELCDVSERTLRDWRRINSM